MLLTYKRQHESDCRWGKVKNTLVVVRYSKGFFETYVHWER